MKTVIETYMDNISRYPLLSEKEETRISGILKSSHDADEIEKAKNLLIVSNLRMVVKQAVHYYRLCFYEHGITIMDLIGGGNIGLVTAVQKRVFDSSKGKFSTFAYPYIKRFMLKTLSSGKIVHHPDRHFYLLRLVQKIKLEQEGVTNKDIIAQLKISPFLLEASEKYDQKWVSGDKGDRLLEASEYEDQITVAESMCQRETIDYLTKKIDKLKPREKAVIKMVMGGIKHDNMGKILKVSRQSTYNLLNGAMDNLRVSIQKDIKNGIFDPDKLVPRNVKISLDFMHSL